MRALLTVFAKEFRENLRERRTLISALVLGPLLGPLLFAGGLSLRIERGAAESDRPITLAVAHGERAPNLLSFLGEHGIEVRPVDYDAAAARAAVRAHRHELVLAVSEDFAARLEGGTPAPVLLYADSSDPSVSGARARVMALIGFCMPRYWLAVLLISLLAVQVGWLPPAGYADLSSDPADNLRHAALPVLSLGLTIAAVQMRFLRSSLLDVLGQDYVRTARAKGLPPRTVSLRHALKNALIPFVTVVGLEMGSLLGGLVVVEQIFSWPGIGWLMINSITQRDYAVVQGSVLLIAAGVVVINLVVDVLYGYLDPRIRYA